MSIIKFTYCLSITACKIIKKKQIIVRKVGNINYFCIVKCVRTFFLSIAICVVSLIFSEIKASNHTFTSLDNDTDSIEISLLTCAPGTEMYSLYGHTVIRYTDYKKDIDLAINYGVFSFDKPFFILRFIFGLTDYEMGVMPFDYFYYEYSNCNRTVIQQVLNLTKEEKLAIIAALEKNYLPENRTYRYNYFYNNCTTRARDIIENNINGKIIFSNERALYPSFRKLIHYFNKDYPWARFGNDILLGANADKNTTHTEYQFLPFNLKKDFDKALIKDTNGKIKPLVKNSFTLIDKEQEGVSSEFFLRPNTCAIIILCVIVLIILFEFLYKKDLWFFDSILMFFDGCIGLVLFIMIFSKHPATNFNLQILLFNPLSLIFIYKVTKDLKNKVTNKFWIYATGLIVLFFFGGIFQNYAEGVYILALSLLLRCTWRIICQNKYNDK